MHTHIRTLTSTHILCHTHQEKHSGTSAAAWELHTGQSMKVMGCWKCHFFLFFYELICILSHQQAGPGFRIETVVIHRLKRMCVCLPLQICKNEIQSVQARCTICIFFRWFVCFCACSGGANRACWRCTAARWLWWGEPPCSATPPAAAGCSAWGSAPRPAAPPCPPSPERHRHTTKQKPSLRSLWQEREGSDRYSGGFKETSWAHINTELEIKQHKQCREAHHAAVGGKKRTIQKQCCT